MNIGWFQGFSLKILVCMVVVALIPLSLLGVYLGTRTGALNPLAAWLRFFLPTFMLSLILAVGLALYLSRQFKDPLARLNEKIEAMESGDLDVSIPTEAKSPIGEVGESLDRMRRTLQSRIEELALSNRVAQVITSSLDYNTLLHDLAGHLADVVNGTGSLIVLQDERTPGLRPMAASGDYYDDYHALEADGGEPSAAQIAISGQRPIVIPDVENSPIISPQIASLFPDKSLLVVPLIVKEQAIGAALIGDNRRKREFTPSEVERAMTMARQVAMVIENAQLYASAQRHLHDLSLLYQTSAAISTTLDEERVFDMATQAFAKVFAVTQCQLIVFEDRIWGRLVAEHREQSSGTLAGIRLPLAGNELLEWVEENKRALAIRDAQNEPMLAGLREPMSLHEAESLLVVPLVSKNDVIGTIILNAQEENRRFSSEELSLAQTLANQIAGVVQNARLYQQMSEEKRKFELAALNMGEGLIILDREDNLLFANPQARSSLDLGNTSLGLPLLAVCPQESLQGLLAQRSQEEDKIVVGEMQATTSAMEKRDLTLSVSPVRDEGGELQWWVLVIHDITRLKELDRLKSEFVSTVSHELRTPLASIIGFAEMLLTEQPGPLTEVQDEFMNIIYQSAEHLLTLVNDLLDVSRMESGRFQLELRKLDPVRLAKQVYNAMEPLAEQKDLEMELATTAEVPMLMADSRRLEQVLNNLVSNAIKFTDSNGRVTILVESRNGEAYFAVKDTGIGIPESEMNELFTKFYRSSESVQKAIGGTGLGLYIAKNIVESHDGEIGAESEEGEGTTVWFTIPFDQPEIGETTEKEEREPDVANTNRG
jgi:two-component system NtrC family sensor kinase